MNPIVVSKLKERITILEESKTKLTNKLNELGISSIISKDSVSIAPSRITTDEHKIKNVINEFKDMINDNTQRKNLIYTFVSKIRLYSDKIEIDLDYQRFLTSKFQSCMRTYHIISI